MRISELMQTDLVTAEPDEGVIAVAARMSRRRVGACLVLEHGRLVGIFTERDLLHLVAAGADVRGLPVARAMTAQVTLAPPDADMLWAGEEMRRLGVRHLPVGEDGHAVGIISLRDLFAVVGEVLRLDPNGVLTARRMLAAAR